MRIFLISIITVLLLSGCWSAVELSDMMLATAIGIDYHDGKFQVTLQVINPSEIAANQDKANRTSVTNYTVEADTFFEAIRRLTATSPRKLFLSHIRVVIYGEGMARRGIADTLDFLMRDHEFRSDFVMTIAKDTTAKKVLGIVSPLENISAEKIYTSIESSEKFWAPTKEVKLDELVNAILSDGKQAVMTGVFIRGDAEKGSTLANVETQDPYATIFVEHIGVFNEDKLIGWLNEDQSKGFNYITDNIASTVGRLIWQDGRYIVLETTSSSTDRSVVIKDDEITITVSVESTANFGEVNADVTFQDQAVIQEIERYAAERLNELLARSIAVAKEFETDIFGFGELIRRDYPHEWEAKYKENWDEYFLTTNIKIDSSVRIEHGGMITNPLYDELIHKQRE
ncbi:spore germination protein KC [Amphibacillus marinus]|uniref:Spore germination protein KC n=1 Tax=Amphibacillus marinus TaxID=872970 RepID=A0A1H8Q1H0_9BACI|nr:Ger(x)C family spore germination protein [Amphibacillus marinus]SEO47831.1 spore germination protein KC [Amphibacillus marinus]